VIDHDVTSADAKRRFWTPIAQWVIDHDLDLIAASVACERREFARAVMTLSVWLRGRPIGDEAIVLADGLWRDHLADIAHVTAQDLRLYESLAPHFGATTAAKTKKKPNHLRVVE
jgi:hypothetical protein